MDDPTADTLAALTRFLVVDSRFDETFKRVAELAQKAIEPASMTGITMLVGDRVTTAFFTDDEVPEIDRAQYDEGDGPCLQSFRTGEVVKVESTLEDDRWPEFCATAAKHGVGSTLSLPLGSGAAALGALNLYAPEPRAFTPEHTQAASTFATHAGVVLANVQAYWRAHEHARQLARATRSRDVIGRAGGILMVQSDIDADRAYELLQRMSKREDRTVRDVAVGIVSRFGGEELDGE